MSSSKYFCPLTLLLIVFLLAPARICGELPVVRIGAIIDMVWENDTALQEIIETDIKALTQGEFDVRFPPEKRFSAEWSKKRASEALDKLLADPEIDMIIADGVLTSYVVSQRKSFSKPVIAPYVIDADILGILTSDGTSGIKNLNYVSFPSPTKSDIKAFNRIVPFRKLTILMAQPYFDKMPDLMDHLSTRFAGEGFEPVIITVGASIDETFAKLPADVEAVYVTPLVMTPPEEFNKLVDGLIDRKLPSYSYWGREEVEKGIMAGSQNDMHSKLGRRVAINIQRILLGEDAGEIPAAFSPNTQLTINMETARKVGIYPGWDILTEAVLLNEEQVEIERHLDIYTAIQEAIEANLDLAATERMVAAGEQNVKEARAPLLPQIDLSGSGVVIDEDQANASFGQVAEKTVYGSVTATQIIFSEQTLANLSIQKKLQRAREQELEQERFDIVQAAATAYLNVLKVKTYEKIQKGNLKRTRSNLEVAQVREVVGSAAPAEVYRWESEIATNRKTVIDAGARRSIAQIELNRLLHRPKEELFLTEEVEIGDLAIISDSDQMVALLRNPQSFKMFRSFMVEESFRNSPELAGLDAAISAGERALSSAKNRFWAPTIALWGNVDHVFSRKGAGSEPGLEMPPLPQPQDTYWDAGLSLDYPLFTGGEKFAGRTKAIEELAQLRLERDAIAERIEQRVRSALHSVVATYAGINEARLAAEAAGKSLLVVENAYSSGAVSILQLLDAQNVSLVADLSAANAIYDFLIELIAYQRAVGSFDLLMSEEEREAYFSRVREYFRKEGMDLDWL